MHGLTVTWANTAGCSVVLEYRRCHIGGRISEELRMSAHFHPGDVVVYRKPKSSVHPGPHARSIHPAPNGDCYSYVVDKFWRVVDIQPDGTLVVRTRKGKQHEVASDDPRLRRPRWWERLLFWHRFPACTPGPEISHGQ